MARGASGDTSSGLASAWRICSGWSNRLAESVDWEALYAEHGAACAAPAAARQLAAPTDDDMRWLVAALKHDEPAGTGRKWFVANLARLAPSLGEKLFRPMLDAGIDEVDPSFNRCFIAPCVSAFGARRVNEYLLDVLESGPDDRKAGAANALYWAQVTLQFIGHQPSWDIAHATPESRMAYEMLEDVWDRKRRLMLELFVANPNVDIRRSLIPSLNLDPGAYAETHRPQVAQAVAIARAHEDDYIRHRVETQLGDARPLAPLPHRKKGPASS